MPVVGWFSVLEEMFSGGSAKYLECGVGANVF